MDKVLEQALGKPIDKILDDGRKDSVFAEKG